VKREPSLRGGGGAFDRAPLVSDALRSEGGVDLESQKRR